MTDLSPELAEALAEARAAWEDSDLTAASSSEGETAVGGEDDGAPEGVLATAGRRGRPVCIFCGVELQSTRNAYRRVVGWERQRKQGGTNAVRLRQPTDDYACRTCVDSIAAGRDPAQGAML